VWGLWLSSVEGRGSGKCSAVGEAVDVSVGGRERLRDGSMGKVGVKAVRGAMVGATG
jgi:hypothetical protein